MEGESKSSVHARWVRDSLDVIFKAAHDLYCRSIFGMCDWWIIPGSADAFLGQSFFSLWSFLYTFGSTLYMECLKLHGHNRTFCLSELLCVFLDEHATNNDADQGSVVQEIGVLR